MSSKDEVISLLADGSEWSAAAIREALPSLLPATVQWALGALVEEKRLERIKPGFYRALPGAGGLKGPQDPPAEPAEPEDTADTPEPLQWALWHDGDLLVRRGEVTLVLTSEERGRLLTWLGQREVA